MKTLIATIGLIVGFLFVSILAAPAQHYHGECWRCHNSHGDQVWCCS